MCYGINSWLFSAKYPSISIVTTNLGAAILSCLHTRMPSICHCPGLWRASAFDHLQPPHPGPWQFSDWLPVLSSVSILAYLSLCSYCDVHGHSSHINDFIFEKKQQRDSVSTTWCLENKVVQFSFLCYSRVDSTRSCLIINYRFFYFRYLNIQTLNV